MALFRFHRGLLADSLATTIIVKNKKELLKKIKEEYGSFPKSPPIADLIIESYGVNPDEKGAFDIRIGWYTQIVVAVSENYLKGKKDEKHHDWNKFVAGFLSEPFDE